MGNLIRQEVLDAKLSIRKITAIASQISDCIRFDIGQPAFDVPQYIKDGAMKALQEKRGYAPYRGYDELRQEIANSEGWKGLKLSKDNITVTTGGMGGLSVLFLTTINPGEEVIVSNPYWSAYNLPIMLSHGKLKAVNLKPGLEELEKNITPKTKWIVVNTPNNPTGEVYSEKFLREIADFAKNRDLYILSDEVYDRIIFNGKHHSIMKFAPERTYMLNSTSKTFAMTGWRLGWIIGPEKEMSDIAKGNRGTVACPNSIAMMGAYTALKEFNSKGKQEVELMVEAYKNRAEVMRKRIESIGWELPFIPDGALYMLPKCCEESWKFSIDLINNIGVSTVPGKAFGAEGHLRFCFGAVEADKIHEAFDRIEKMN